MTRVEAERLLPPSREVGPFRARLLCLPFAGASASLFWQWPRAMPGVDVRAVQWPARQERLNEPAIDGLVAAAAAVVGALATLEPLPLTLYGHSFGGLVGYEVARALEAIGQTVSSLMVGSAACPTTLRKGPRLTGLGDIAFAEAIAARYGGSGALVKDAELRALSLPGLRADIAAVEQYVHQPGRTLTCPVSVIRGSNDSSIAPSEAKAWQSMTTGPFRVVELDAGHFFLETHQDWVIAAAREAVAAQGVTTRSKN